MDADRSVPITMKALLGYGGSRILAKHAGSMAGRFGAATEDLFIRRGAAKAAIRISGNTLGKVAGRLSGPLVLTVILVWDIYDHRRTEIENRPILRNAIEKYLGLVRDSILYDPSTGLESTLMGAGFGELGHRSRFNSASGTVNSATSVRVNSVEPDSV